MKKVGIVTIHKINNYGAALQAYALNRQIRSLGHDARTIDFRTYRVAESYQLLSKVPGKMDLVRNAQALLYAGKLRRRKARFDIFLEENVPMTDQAYYSDEELRQAELNFDTYVCGSDQIWNYDLTEGLHPAYFLDFAHAGQRRIAYAPSVNHEQISEPVGKQFQEKLRDYHAVSVREEDNT